MVGFLPGFATDRQYLFHGIVKPYFKTNGYYSSIVTLSKISGYVRGAQCKARAGGCCRRVAALLYSIFNYAKLGLAIIPED